MNAEEIIRDAWAKNASDVHIQQDAPLFYRIDGALQPQGEEKITREEIGKLTQQLLSENEACEFAHSKNFDKGCDVRLDGAALRVRINMSYACQKPLLVLRLLNSQIPSFEELLLPPRLCSLAEAKAGLLLITGSTGSGKSTTVAALIEHINQNCSKHIITLEDPVEYLHSPIKSLITQKELGKDFDDTAVAVRNALRQDPDIIVIGEIRDAETLRAALTAAETGHLIIATLHTQNAAQTISRLAGLCPKNEADELRAQLAQTLLAVMSQQLVKRRGAGRALLTELLIATDAAKNLIKEGKTAQLEYVMQTGADKGMHSFAQSKSKLLERGIIAK